MTGPAGRPRWPGADLPGRRLFVAAPLPDATSAAVARLVDDVRAAGVPGGGRDVRWVRLDGLHLTLRFLGPTAEDRVEPAAAAVRAVAHGQDPIDIAIDGAGAFPPSGRPRALWLGITDGADRLAELAVAVDEALMAAGWTFDARPFTPHLTLARADGVPAGGAIADRLISAAADLDLRSRVTTIGLFESLTGGGPARYVALESAELGGSAGA
jgi:2'-5' RNA ligase